MSDARVRVVFDCNVFAQALIKPSGPAGTCVEMALAGELRLFWSSYVMAEVERLPQKPTPRRLGISGEMVASLVARVAQSAIRVDDPPHVYDHPIDAKDSHYINLAVATDSALIASSDKHLLNLMDSAQAAGADFKSRFPTIEVLQPWELVLRVKRQSKEQP